MKDSRNNLEILLVEDSDSDAELVIRALKKVNLANHLVRLKDGAEALEFIFHPGKNGEVVLPRVILLDIKMPRVDGIQVLKQIRSDDRTRLIPVVIMTSSKEEQDIVTSYQLGVNSFVVKPVEFAAFAKAVSDLGLYWLLVNQSPVIHHA